MTCKSVDDFKKEGHLMIYFDNMRFKAERFMERVKMIGKQ